eukprot:Lankesteria_metandrocarpae@DN606_c0_g1_i1.p1
MYNINATKKLNELELNKGIEGNASWHQRYKNSTYIYIGGLPYNLSEGDVIVVFSQWGETVDVNLIRDQKTGKSKGFCFVGYEDQRSTILAVDNGNGMTILGRTLRVDHVAKYRAPEKFIPQLDDEGKHIEGAEPVFIPHQATGAEGAGLGVLGITESEKIHQRASQMHSTSPTVPNDQVKGSGNDLPLVALHDEQESSHDTRRRDASPHARRRDVSPHVRRRDASPHARSRERSRRSEASPHAKGHGASRRHERSSDAQRHQHERRWRDDSPPDTGRRLQRDATQK